MYAKPYKQRSKEQDHRVYVKIFYCCRCAFGSIPVKKLYINETHNDDDENGEPVKDITGRKKLGFIEQNLIDGIQCEKITEKKPIETNKKMQ